MPKSVWLSPTKAVKNEQHIYTTSLADYIDSDYIIYLQIQAPVVQRPDNFFRWIRHSSAPKMYFTLNVVQGFRTLPN